MKNFFKNLKTWTIFPSLFLILFGLFIEFSPFFSSEAQEKRGVFFIEELPLAVIFQKNTILAFSNPNNPSLPPPKRISVVVTGYSSTPCQTDDDPYITAAGTLVRKGIVANNFLPFGTKIKIPELFGDEIFIVEDRMHWRKGNYIVDVWFPDYWQALNFGAHKTYIEIVEE